MRYIYPRVEHWVQNDIWDHIAKCTRVCYQSSPKDNESSEEFVKRVILHSSTGEVDKDKIHGAMLEHGTVYLSWLYDLHVNDTEKYIQNPYSYVILEPQDNGDVDTFITTNLRVIIENNWLNDLRYQCKPTIHKRRYTLSFITDIGVSRELNRHRVHSICEESTRYCNYANNKFDKSISTTIPKWFRTDEANMRYFEHHVLDKFESYMDDFLSYYEDGNITDIPAWNDIDWYLFAIVTANYCYNKLISKGWTPQQARQVLPLATKTQVVHTAFIDDWIHFFKLRADGISGKVHPHMKELAAEAKNLLIKSNYEHLSD